MSDDILNLIAEARRRQEVAEQERDQWKRRLRAERARLKSIIQLIRRAPITPPDVDTDGRVDWQQLEHIIKQACEVFCDPSAFFQPDEDDLSLTGDQAQILLANQLADMIEAAVKKAKGA